MKSLNQFAQVKQALEQVVAESDVNNGTQGVIYTAHFFEQETAYDEQRAKIQNEIARGILMNKIDHIPVLQAQLESLPKPQIIMVWKLVEPIAVLTGTKPMKSGDKELRLVMHNVDKLYIPENALKLDLIEYEETDQMGKDMQGRDAQIVKLRLRKGIIDVAPPIMRNTKEIRGKRAYVTPISYKALQVVGSMMFKEKQSAERLYGFEEI